MTIFPVAVIVFSVIVVTAISCHRRRRRSSSARSMFIDETEEQVKILKMNFLDMKTSISICNLHNINMILIAILQLVES